MTKSFIPYSNSVVLKNKFKIIKNLTNKAYTQVYEAKVCESEDDADDMRMYDKRTDQKIIVKRECYQRRLQNNGFSLLQNEHKILDQLNSLYETGFPVVIMAKHEKMERSKTEKGNFNLLMTHVGTDLKSYYNNNRSQFSLKFIKQIGYELIDLIEKLHKIGYVHGDLKPENICIGKVYDRHTCTYQSNDIVHLIDFELCSPYIDPETMMHVKSEEKSFSGNLKFGSMRSCFGMNKSRRDDMESIAYILMYFYFGYLPWDKVRTEDIESKTIDHYKMYGKKKQISLNDEFFKSVPDCLFHVFKESIEMRFSSVPNYSRFKSMLQE